MPLLDAPARHPSINLQLAVLRHLPTPVLVLSPYQVIIFANHSAERMLGGLDHIQSSGQAILDRSPAELGIKLLHNRIWSAVLDRLVSARKVAEEDGEGRGREGIVHEVDALISNTKLSYEERHFRILASTLTTDDEMNYMLSFERSARAEKITRPAQGLPIIEKKIFPRKDQIHSPDGGGLTTPTVLSPNGVVDWSKNISRIKKAVFDSCGVAGFILSADENFYLTNKKTRELLGDVMGGADGCDGQTLRNQLAIWDETFSRRLDPSEFPGMRLVKSRTPFTDYRYGFAHAITGALTVMRISGECLYDDDTGEFVGGICWCRDLQEYSGFLSDQQQRRLESHETICDLMPHMVWTTTPDGLTDYCSQRWYDFTGLTKAESIGDGFKLTVHPDDLPILLNKQSSHEKGVNECEVELRYRRKDGIYRWMLTRACPLRDDSGKILKWYGTNTDIHDLVMQRIEASHQNRQMLTVLAHAEVNIFLIDSNRKVSMAEGAMTWVAQGKQYDFKDKPSLIGKDAIEISQNTQEGGIPGYEQNVLNILSGKVDVAQSEDLICGRVYRTRLVAEMEHNTNDGGKKPVVKGVVGLSIDVTDMKARVALELDNTRLMTEEQAAKDSNQIKSQFLANMSHEMRTPTAGVIGMVDLLSEDPTLTAEQREYVSSIQLSSKALLTIVNDILDFSKIESGRLDIEEVPFKLSAILAELCKMLGMFTHQKGLAFVYENSMDETLEMVGDPGRTRQVLSNLLTNALKFTKEGTIKLEVSAMKVFSENIDDEILEVQFVIVDTGIGIEKTVLDKLFRPFSQGDSSTARLYGGTGLGLTISRNLASLMNGSIALKSTPNKGSTAIFKIPLKVSCWCRKVSLKPPSPADPGFRYYSQNNRSVRSPTWTQPQAHRTINQDLLNQQISNSGMKYSPVSTVPTIARHVAVDAVSMKQLPELPQKLTPEERKQVHVLVVEDNAINQTIAIQNIRRLGFPVTAVWNGHEALSYLASPSSSQPRPSIILMDVQMPVMDGYEATKILRADAQYALPDPNYITIPERGKRMGMVVGDSGGGKWRMGSTLLRDIPVIAMTASAIQGDREKCHAAGMDDYLAKPVEKAMLEEMLIKWAGRSGGAERSG